MRDMIVNGAAGGLGAGIITGITSPLLHYFGISNECFVQIGGEMITTAPLWSVSCMITSEIVHLFFSMTWGVLLALFLFYFSNRYYLVKGLIYGGFLWLVNIVFLAPALGLLDKNNMNLPTLFDTLGNHLLYGLLAALFIVKLGLRSKEEI